MPQCQGLLKHRDQISELCGGGEGIKIGQTWSSMPNTISYNLDKISELLEVAYVRAFKACNLRAWTSKMMDEKYQIIIYKHFKWESNSQSQT